MDTYQNYNFDEFDLNFSNISDLLSSPSLLPTTSESRDYVNNIPKLKKPSNSSESTKKYEIDNHSSCNLTLNDHKLVAGLDKIMDTTCCSATSMMTMLHDSLRKSKPTLENSDAFTHLKRNRSTSLNEAVLKRKRSKADIVTATSTTDTFYSTNSTSSTSTVVHEKEEKRLKHNETERRRVSKMNGFLDKMKEIMISESGKAHLEPKRNKKIRIFEDAVSFMEICHAERNSLRSKTKVLELELNQLRSKTAKGGLPAAVSSQSTQLFDYSSVLLGNQFSKGVLSLDGIILAGNSMFYNNLNASESELIGKSIVDYVPGLREKLGEKSNQQVYEFTNEFLSDPTVMGFETIDIFRFPKEDKASLCRTCHELVLDKDGKPSYFLLTTFEEQPFDTEEILKITAGTFETKISLLRIPGYIDEKKK